MRVLKRAGSWHYWCPCCMGGDWYWHVTIARAAALAHAAVVHADGTNLDAWSDTPAAA